MRKLCVYFFALAAFTLICCDPAYANNDVKVFLGNEEITFADVKPMKINDRIVVPLRTVSERLNADVSWNEATSEITVIRGGEFAQLTVDSNVMKLGIVSSTNEEFIYTADIIIDVPAIIVDGRTLLPLRAVAEAFKLNISWDEETSSAIIDNYSKSNADGWLYYASWSDGGRLYRIDTNGQNRQKLSDYDCYETMLVDDYLYYHVWNTSKKDIFRVNINGEGERKLSDSWIHFIDVYDNMIYYANLNESDDVLPMFRGKLYRMDMNCENPQKLTDEDVFYPMFYGDWIYYGVENEDGAIYKIDMNGENRTRVNPKGMMIDSSLLEFRDGWFYLGDDMFANVLYRMNLNGNVQELTRGESLYIREITDDYIFFTDDWQLYRMNLDGTGRKLIAQGSQLFLQEIKDNLIYYSDIGSAPGVEEAIYCVNINGEDNKKIFVGDASVQSIVGDKLFILDDSENGFDDQKGAKLYKSDLNGGNMELLSEFHMRDVKINDNWIYFRNTDDGHKYYKMDLNGENVTRITNEQTWHIILSME